MAIPGRIGFDTRRVASRSTAIRTKPMARSSVVGSPARPTSSLKLITRYNEEKAATAARAMSYQGMESFRPLLLAG